MTIREAAADDAVVRRVAETPPRPSGPLRLGEIGDPGFGLPRIEELANHLVVSFDIFDTLIVRPFRDPTGLFRLVEWSLRQEFSMAAAGWTEARIAAEAEARRQIWDLHGRPEIRLAEMRQSLALQFSGPIAERGLALELEHELQTCRPHPVLRNLYAAVRQAGPRIVLVSDFYLDLDVVTRMLTRCGYRGWDKLFLSSRELATKARGDLFAALIDDLKVDPARIIHIGDNVDADGKAARKLGLNAVTIPKAIELFERNPVRRRIAARRIGEHPAASFWDSAASGLYALRCCRGEGFESGSQDDAWRRIGYFVGGPAIHGFARFVVDQCRRRGIRAAWFLARDGLIVKQAIERLKIAPKALRLDYVYASRRCFNIAAIEKIDGDTMHFLSSGTTPHTAVEFVERAGVDPAEPKIAAALQRHFADPDQPVRTGEQYSRLRDTFAEIGDQIVENARAERALLLRYLEQLDLDAAEVAVIDIGWQGTLQKALMRLLDGRTRFKGRMLGMYFGTYEHALPDSLRHSHCSYLFERGRPSHRVREIRECIEFAELLFAPPQPGVVRMVERNGKIEPLLSTAEFEAPRLAISKLIHEGIFAWLDDVREADLHLAPPPLDEYIQATLNSVLQAPTREEARLLGKVPHAEGFSGTHYRLLVPPAPPAAHLFELKRRFDEAFWKQGFRAQLSGPQKLALKVARRLKRR